LYNVLDFRTYDIFKEYCVAKILPYISVTRTQNQLTLGNINLKVPFCFTPLYVITCNGVKQNGTFRFMFPSAS